MAEILGNGGDDYGNRLLTPDEARILEHSPFATAILTGPDIMGDDKIPRLIDRISEHTIGWPREISTKTIRRIMGSWYIKKVTVLQPSVACRKKDAATGLENHSLVIGDLGQLQANIRPNVNAKIAYLGAASLCATCPLKEVCQAKAVLPNSVADNVKYIAAALAIGPVYGSSTRGVVRRLAKKAKAPF